MDRALKERIIGIIVLVVFAVIIVPVFLDGPADDASIVTETLVLPGQDPEARKQQTIVLDRDRSEPVPAAVVSQPPAEKPAEKKPPEQTVASNTGQRIAEQKPAAPAEKPGTAAVATETSETGMWAVQLGSFSNQANAERLAADLRKEGYAAFLSQLQTSGGLLQRVRIGPQKDRDSAEAVAAKLKAAGHASQVVPHP
jgi:DedD protein